MKLRLSAVVLATGIAVGAAIVSAGQQAGQGASGASSVPPPWAYVVAPPPATPPAQRPAQPPADDPTPRHVPGSNMALTWRQVRDFTNVPDWHPEDHPPMPDIVAHGRPPDVRFGCGYCHLPNGKGRPENAGVAGLPAAYIVQQMADYKNGLRKSSEPRMGPPALMLALAKNANDAEVKAAAEYFSRLKFTPWIKVVETNTPPKAEIVGGMFMAIPGGGTEPIGKRVLEMPEDRERAELRDSQSGFIAYVPFGSIKKGEELVTTGGAKVVGGKIAPGKTIQCSICHGQDLKGLGPVPGIAGRSPSYTARQLYDMQHGNRTGLGAELMKAIVANLTEEDIISIVAYTASRMP